MPAEHTAPRVTHVAAPALAALTEQYRADDRSAGTMAYEIQKETP